MTGSLGHWARCVVALAVQPQFCFVAPNPIPHYLGSVAAELHSNVGARVA